MTDGFDVKQFVESFPTLAAAEGGIAKLRGLVLDLAVRGLLVPQLRLDGSAFELLTTIRSVASPGVEVEARHPIPASWAWTTLGRVCSYIQRGKSPKYADNSTIPVVSQKCVQWEGFLLDRARFIDPTTLNAYGTCQGV